MDVAVFWSAVWIATLVVVAVVVIGGLCILINALMESGTWWGQSLGVLLIVAAFIFGIAFLVSISV